MLQLVVLITLLQVWYKRCSPSYYILCTSNECYAQQTNVVDTCLALSTILLAHGSPENCLELAFGTTETSVGSRYNNVFPVHNVR